MDDFLHQIYPLEHPVKDASGDILFATMYKLGETYNVYAAASDLPEPMTYIETEKYVKQMKGELVYSLILSC